MKQYNLTYIAVFLLCAMGVWGCSQQRTGAISAKINELENRYAKLDEDYRTLHVTYDQQKKKLTQTETKRAALEKDNAELNQQLETLRTERQNLSKQVAERTKERDEAQANLADFARELQSLVGRVEAAMNKNSPSGNATIIPASRRSE